MRDYSKAHTEISRKAAVLLFVLGTSLSAALMFVGVAAEASRVVLFQETDSIKVGERLTYNVSLDGFGNVGHADLWVVSRGRTQGRDSFEVRLKMKTFEIVNAAFFQIDEVRTAYLDAASGLPFAMKRILDPNGFPRETVSGFPQAPSGLDISALIYKVRRAGGQGKFRLVDGDDKFWVEMKSRDGGRIETEAGAFDTVVSQVRSRYFRSIGISDVKVNLSSDDAHVPVQISFKTERGLMVARLIGMTSAKAAAPAAAATPTPVPFPVANPVRTKPTPVKTPYVNDRPLGTDLPFSLKEKLTFRVKNGESAIGKVSVEVRERRIVEGKDSLVLLLNVLEASSGANIFSKDDFIRSNVDPGSILPFSSDIAFRGTLSALNFSGRFDQDNGTVTLAGATPMNITSNTHTLLSLLFAMRTFNLKQSKSVGNPVNDTRVSVIWGGKSVVFTLRPIDMQAVTIDGTKFQAQQIGLITGDPQIDALNIRIWLSVDDFRRPVKLSVGSYNVELVSAEYR